MVGPHWRIGVWTFLSIPAGTGAWGCLILFGAPDDGADTVRQFVVIIGAAIALVTMAFYLCTACTDPGIVFRHTAPPVTAGLPGQQQRRGGGAVEVRGFWVGPRFPSGTTYVGAGARTQGKGYDGATVVPGAAEEAKKVAGGWGTEDVEAQQILDILTEEYNQGASSEAAVPADQCVAAAEAGSGAVVDMRNVAPPEGPPTVTPTQGRAVVMRGVSTTNFCGHTDLGLPPGAIHCTQCGVCVVKLDHHCPFMGQCVGRKTLFPFYLFVVSVWSLIVYVLLAVGYLVVAVVYHGL
ncbi:unnamed protein product [Scytosiphon promiscuus]